MVRLLNEFRTVYKDNKKSVTVLNKKTVTDTKDSMIP